MERAPSPTSWNLESDEIASVTSEDLHANRPNRWTGPESSWRGLTTDERLLWRSMQQLQNQDLALHLYNAFALKRAARSASTARWLAVRTDDGDDAVWAPPKAWTAWPLRERHVPRQALVEKHDDEDERFTFRKAEPRLPRSQLHEELAATILRQAKERFRKRGWSISARADATGVELGEDAASLPSSPPTSDRAGGEGEGGEMQMDHVPGQVQDEHQPAKRARRASPQTHEPVVSTKDDESYEPVISADDDKSYELLDPCVRHIIAQLDRTLTILHNTRVACVSQLSDSSTDSESGSQTSRRRGRGRPRRSPQPGDEVSDALSSAAADAGGGRRRGRPRKVRLPRPGESDDEFRVRVAREGHRRIPWTLHDRDAAFEAWLREGDEKLAARDQSAGERSEVADETATDEDGDASNVEERLARWGLRDWSDVLGAAALADFPEGVIKRTAKRCARLMGEGIVMRRLDETPASRARDLPTAETKYRPEPVRRSFTSSRPGTPCSSAAAASADDTDDETSAGAAADEDDSAGPTLEQRRIASLASTPSPRRGRHRLGSESSASQSRSRSRSHSSAGLAFCPVASCERAATGFTRRVNLRRHMHLVHPGRAADADADSDDEVLGAVHVDGFLRPIAPGRGWRGDGARRQGPRGRRAKAPASGRRRVDPRGGGDGDGAGGAGRGGAGSDAGGETTDGSC